jgi:hypothetical protein
VGGKVEGFGREGRVMKIFKYKGWGRVKGEVEIRMVKEV